MKRFCAALLPAVFLFCALPFSAGAAESVQTVVGGPTVEAPSVLLMEKETGSILYEENAHEKREPASVTKIMTLLLVMEAIDGGQLSTGDTVTVSAHAASMGGSQVYLKEGEQMTVDDLLKAVAVVSGNDAAVALAEHIAGSEEAFVSRMNQRAAELGMEDTTFLNCTGLPAAGHLTSAYDIALMSRALLSHPDIRQYTTIWMDSIRGVQFQLSNTNRLVRFYPGCTGLKTGSTDSAGYCLSASAERWVQPVLQGSGKVVVRRSQLDSVTTELRLAENVEAPVDQDQVLGEVTVLVNGQPLASLPLTAQTAVERLTIPGVFRRLLDHLFMAA